jgi:glutamate synthase (NADPH) large chain
VAREAQLKHEHAFRPLTESETELAVGGTYHQRVNGEYHLLNPLTISKLQQAVRQESFQTFQEYTDLIDKQSSNLATLRSLMKFKKSAKPVPIEEVEPAKEIVKRFHHGSDVIRFDQQRGARDSGHRHEPHRREVQYRRRRRR